MHLTLALTVGKASHMIHMNTEMLEREWGYSRLLLGGVVAQGDALALDLVETLLTEVVPVSNKPIFG